MKTTIALLLICTAVFAQQKGTGTFTDSRDKKKYKTVSIGGLTWMAENLSYNAKGSTCPGEGNNDDESNKSILCDKNGVTTECVNIECLERREERTRDGDFLDVCVKYKTLTAKQVQDKKKAKDKEIQANCAKEGRLYSNLQDTSNSVCPAGWHLPNKSEWGILKDAIGNDTDEHNFRNVSSFQVASSGSVRCVQGKTSEEAVAAAVAATVGKQFNPKIQYGSITDARDKTTYKTVKIGEQTWMAENLNYNAEGSRCYNGHDNYCKKYGRLYERAAGKTACPAGWHLPSDKEWQTLVSLAGGSNSAGKKLKAGGDDQYGFSALMSGNCQNLKVERCGADMGDIGNSYWWSSTEGLFQGKGTLYYPKEISISYYNDKVINEVNVYKSLNYVRCMEGEAPKEEPAPAAPAATPAKAAAPANSPSKTMYCVSYVTGKPVSCMELKEQDGGKKFCDIQNKSMKMMFGEAKLTETKPSIKCDK